MISFRKEEDSNKQQKAYDKLIEILSGEEEYYNGSFHEGSDLTELVQIVYKTLFDQKNNSILEGPFLENPLFVLFPA